MVDFHVNKKKYNCPPLYDRWLKVEGLARSYIYVPSTKRGFPEIRCVPTISHLAWSENTFQLFLGSSAACAFSLTHNAQAHLPLFITLMRRLSTIAACCQKLFNSRAERTHFIKRPLPLFPSTVNERNQFTHIYQ